MQLSTIFSRAWQQKYLTPAERSIYKFVLTVFLLIPNGALLGGLAAVLDWLHTSLPAWLWVLMAAIIQVILTSVAKYVTSQGDVQVGAVLQGLEVDAATDIAAQNARVSPFKPTVSAPNAAPPATFTPRASKDLPPRG